MKKPLAALLLLLTSGFAAAQGTAPVAGRDYVEIEGGSPLEAVEGKIVVEEFFNYICPACYSFEPRFLAWQEKLPDNVVVHHVPATFRPDFKFYAGVYYTARALGVEEETHAQIYEAIHAKHSLPGEGEQLDENKVANFYADYGVSPDEFLKTLHGFSVDSDVRRATSHMQESQVRSTPSLVINGRYLVISRSYAQIFSTADFLVDMVSKASE